MEHSRGKPSRRVDGTDGRYEVTVPTDVYAYFVKPAVPVDSTRFSDNYFDLFPGQERVIEVWNEAGRRLDKRDIEVSCLCESRG